MEFQEHWSKIGILDVASLWKFHHSIFVYNICINGRKRCYVNRIKMFNTQFEELHQKQSQWAVPDSELRESLRLAVAEVLLPAYRSFVKRFGCVFSFLKQLQTCVCMHASICDCVRMY